MTGQTDRSMNGQTDRGKDERNEVHQTKRTDRWMNGQTRHMKGWTDRSLIDNKDRHTEGNYGWNELNEV
jgi:hypothetical protein